MQAVVLREFGSADNLRAESVANPSPGPGEVLLRIRACGVCFHDVINRRGNLPRTRVPAILGHEVAGEVIALGEGVSGWSVGDGAATLQRLSCGQCAACRAGRPSLCKVDTRFFGEELQGGYAEMMAAPVAGLGRVPRGTAWEVAATACCTTGTAVHCLRTRGLVQPGETVLITGASGGVGLQAVQLASYDGARVIAVTSSEKKTLSLTEAGADEVVVSPDLDFSAEVRRRTGGEGVNLALEIVGSGTLLQSLRSLAPGGRLVVVGNLETASVMLNPGLIIVKELNVMGAYATTTSELEEAFRLIRTGAVRPWVTEVMALREAAEAHRLLEQRRVTGRLVLRPED